MAAQSKKAAGKKPDSLKHLWAKFWDNRRDRISLIERLKVLRKDTGKGGTAEEAQAIVAILSDSKNSRMLWATISLAASTVVLAIATVIAVTSPELHAQTENLKEQTRFLTRPAKIEIVVDFYGNHVNGIGNPINLTLANTGAQSAVIKYVQLLALHMNRPWEKEYTVWPINFPKRVIPPNDLAIQSMDLYHLEGYPDRNQPFWVSYQFQVIYNDSTRDINATSPEFRIVWQKGGGDLWFGNCESSPNSFCRYWGNGSTSLALPHTS